MFRNFLIAHKLTFDTTDFHNDGSVPATPSEVHELRSSLQMRCPKVIFLFHPETKNDYSFELSSGVQKLLFHRLCLFCTYSSTFHNHRFCSESIV